MTIEEAVSKFARNKKDAEKIRAIYKTANKDFITNLYRTFDRATTADLDFMCASSKHMCRVIQVWEYEYDDVYLVHDHLNGTWEQYPMSDSEAIDLMIQQREIDIEINGWDYELSKIEKKFHHDEFWYVRYLSPCGDVLFEGRSPFAHKSHPFTICLGHLIDGEIHSFVENIIDQQRYINRLITLNDFILRTSAKGVTLVPEDCIPDDMSPEEFAEKWTSVDGLIIYKPKTGSNLKPEIFHNNSTNIGINEMLQLQLGLIDRISSVHGALQGKEAASGTSAARYGMEAQNATTALAAILKTFTSFTEDIAKKKVKIMQQYYEDGRFIATNTNSSDIMQYDAVSAQDVEYSISIRESAASPVYRMVANDWLKELWLNSNGLITVQDLLRYGDFPFADKLLQDIEERQQQVKQGEVPDEILSENMQQQIGANADSVQAAQSLLMGA